MADFGLGTIEAAHWGVNNPPPKDNIHSGKKISMKMENSYG